MRLPECFARFKWWHLVVAALIPLVLPRRRVQLAFLRTKRMYERNPRLVGVDTHNTFRQPYFDRLRAAIVAGFLLPSPGGVVANIDVLTSAKSRTAAVTAGAGGDMLTRMKQVVRFAATPAGRIAYSMTGSGPPLVCMIGWVSHLGLMWEDPEHRRFIEAPAREHPVIRYDKVGCGLSDRTRTDFTLASELAALEALVEHLELKRFALFG